MRGPKEGWSDRERRVRGNDKEGVGRQEIVSFRVSCLRRGDEKRQR